MVSLGLAIGHFGVHGEAGAYVDFTVPSDLAEYSAKFITFVERIQVWVAQQL